MDRCALRREGLVQHDQKNDSRQKHNKRHEKMAIGKDVSGGLKKSHASMLLCYSQNRN
jgi:hypothetical protein